MGSDVGEGVQAGDLFDGFEAYQTPTVEEYRAVLNSGLIVLDANVLLDLYRYNHDTRQDMFRVLDYVKERVWIPRQVALEFWRGREGALADPDARADGVASSLQEICDSVPGALSAWANRVSLARQEKDRLIETISAGFRSAIGQIREIGERGELSGHEDSNQDRILADLGKLLQGRVGAPLSEGDFESALKEADRRIEHKIPPGYLDRKKGGLEVAGDYLLWRQTMIEASRVKKNVLLVTRDVKEDWWRSRSGRARGPRPELVEEMKREAGVRLFMMRPDSLLYHASSLLKIKVSESSVEDVESVYRSEADSNAADDGVKNRINKSMDRDELVARLLLHVRDVGYQSIPAGGAMRVRYEFWARSVRREVLLAVSVLMGEYVDTGDIENLSHHFSEEVLPTLNSKEAYLVVALDGVAHPLFVNSVEKTSPDVALIWREGGEWTGSMLAKRIGLVAPF